MKVTYVVKFAGRKKGALGVREDLEAEVTIDDSKPFEDVVLSLYDNYEHIAYPVHIYKDGKRVKKYYFD